MIKSIEDRRRFGIHELGLLENSADRSFDIVLQYSARLLGVGKIAFMVFNDERDWLVSKASVGLGQIQKSAIGLAIAGSLASEIRFEGTSLVVEDIYERPHLSDCVEKRIVGIASYIGSPVHGPAGVIVGVLAAMSDTPRQWTRSDRKTMEDSAYLLSQRIMLKASFETLRLVSAERKRISQVS